MNKYHIVSLSEKSDRFLVIANTYINPINEFIIQRYVPFIKDGEIIIDLTLVNGFDFNRFATARVKDHKLEKQSIRVRPCIDNQILRISTEYFQRNMELVERSTLPAVEKYLLSDSATD